MTHRSLPRAITVIMAILLLAALTSGCEDDNTTTANKQPTIQLTAGPMNGDSTAWNASFQWEGTDPDGVIDHYQYALDVPPELMDAIDNPGPSDIDWQTTTATEGSFPFTTPSPDSAYGTDGTPGPPTRYTGQNTFVIRAVDDDGGVSRAEYVAFTGLNYAPRTLLAEGAYENQEVQFWHRNCTFLHWRSEDPETPGAGSTEIAGYEYKLRRMPFTWNPFGQDVDDLIEWLDDVSWVPLPPDSAELKPVIQTGPYIFAVRALDRSGAREEVLIKGRNLIIGETSSLFETPTVTVRERTIGSATGPGPTWEAQVATVTELQFEMTGDASSYGGTIDSYNYGVDVEPDSDDSGPGWAGWSANRLTEVIRLDEPGIHTLVFKARDSRFCRSGETWLILVLRVIQMPFDREMLYVDDFRRGTSQGFTDADHDRRNKEMLRAAGIPIDDPGQFEQFDAFGSNDQQSEPRFLQLSEISAFKMVYWDCLGTGSARNPALIAANACDSGRILQAYVAAGGALWVAGQTTFAGFDLAPGTSCLANSGYAFGSSKTGLRFGPGDFLCDFMGYCGEGILNVRTTPETHGLAAVEASSDAVTAGFPDLAIDRIVVPGTANINLTDFASQPLFDATDGLDSLYLHRAGSPSSFVDRKPNAFRYHDPDPVPDQGPVAVFGFPLHLLEQGSVEHGTGTFKAARVMVDWLRSEQQRFFDTHAPGGGTASGGR